MMLGLKGLNGWPNGLASRHKSDTTLVVSLKTPGQIVGTRGNSEREGKCRRTKTLPTHPRRDSPPRPTRIPAPVPPRTP